MFTSITHCRICSGELRPLFNIPAPLVSGFPPFGTDRTRLLSVPLDVVQCLHCLHVQLRYSVDPQYLYSEYWYESGVNERMRQELGIIVQRAQEVVSLDAGDCVLDIGANDGTLLKAYPQEVHKVAVEPSTTFNDTLRTFCDSTIQGTFPECFAQIPINQYKVISTIAMFYDLRDPVEAALRIRQLLHAHGVWICQFQDLEQQVRAGAWDNTCLPASEPVVTLQGLRPISEIKEGDEVLSHTGYFRKVTKLFTRDYVGEIVALRAYGMGHTLRVTPNHPVLVEREKNRQWVAAGDVRPGDWVARPILQETKKQREIIAREGIGKGWRKRRFPVNHDLMRVIGFYLSEGTRNKLNNTTVMSFGHKPSEVTLAESCAASIRALGAVAHVYRRPQTTLVQTYGALARWLAEEFGHGAEHKHLSDVVLRLPVGLQETLLQAYAAGDGYVYRERHWRISTVSKQLALDVAMLANRCGWTSAISVSAGQEVRQVNGRTQHCLPLWDILIQREPGGKPSGKTKLEKPYQWAKVRAVQRLQYVGKVHNLEVEIDHTYVSPAMAVHNCHEHLSYYTLATFNEVVRRAGLQITDVEPSTINGGSLRVFVQHPHAQQHMDRIATQYFREHQTLDHPWPERFARRMQRNILQIEAMVDSVVGQQGVVDLYGASTKGNTLLQATGISDRVRAAWERNPRKFGRTTVTGIRIIDESEGRGDPPDVLLTTIWQFRKQIIEREQETLKTVRLILPLPEAVWVETAHE